MVNRMRLDLDLKRMKGELSTEEALRDVEPFEVPVEVLEGKKKIIIDGVSNGCKGLKVHMSINNP